MEITKRIFSFIGRILFVLVLAGIFIQMGFEKISILIMLGGLGYSIYRLFTRSVTETAPSHTPESLDSSSRSKVLRSSGTKNKVDSDFFFKLTLDDNTPEDRFVDYSIPQRTKRCQAKFVDNESSIRVSSFQINGPIYVGDMNGVEGSDDPAIIDISLPLKKQKSVEPLGYWPSYKASSPEQRGQYLEWLAGNRDNIDELGYVFIYFYGMERYVFLDAATDSEVVRGNRLGFIVKELQRLQKIFPDNRSFQGYSTNLLDAIFINYFPKQLDRRKFSCPEKNPLAAKYVIARHANEGIAQCLDSDWALHWLLTSGKFNRTKTAREQYSLLRAIFNSQYEAAGGIQVPTNKIKLSIDYEPASSGMRGDAVIDFPEYWCNPMVLQRPVKHLLKMSENLMPMVRKVAKASALDNPLDILAAWPVDLKTNPPTKLAGLLENINNFCSKHASPTLSALGLLFGVETHDKIPKSQLTKFADALSVCGWVLVPDPIVTPASLSKTDRVQLYKGTRPEIFSTTGRLLDLKIRLAAILARADGEIHEHELSYINRIVNEHGNTLEREYFLRYTQWRLSSKTSNAGLKAQIDALNVKSRENLATVLVEIAHADGVLSKDEIKQLENLFTKIGLDKSHVARYLHESAFAPAITTARSNTASLSESSSAKSTSSHEIETIKLDLEILKSHAESTEDIQSVLGQIFDEAEPELETEGSTSALAHPDIWHNGTLDDNHHVLVEWLFTREQWARSEVEAQCEKLGLLTDGALECINEVAFDHLGDSLIEIDDPVLIYHDVLPAESRLD